MAIYSMSVSVTQRSKGQSSVASAAYISGGSFRDKRTGEKHAYARHDVIDLGTTLPGGKSVETAQLWNDAEAADKRMNSRTSRKFVLALPNELPKSDHTALVKDFRSFLQKEYGAAVTACLHYDRDGNPHAHLQMTTREWSDQGAGPKIRNLDGSHSQRKEAAESMRSTWADLMNSRLIPAGHQPVDHRSYKRQGVDRVATKHLGAAAAALEARGVSTEIGEFNRAALAVNSAQAEAKSVEAEQPSLKDRVEAGKKKGVFGQKRKLSFGNNSNFNKPGGYKPSGPTM